MLVPCLASLLECAMVLMLEVVSVVDLALESGLQSDVGSGNDSVCVLDVRMASMTVLQ